MNYIDKQERLTEELSAAQELAGQTGILIQHGKRLPAMWSGYRTSANMLGGCLSKTWFVCEVTHEGLLHIEGESDSLILRGVIEIMRSCLDGEPAREVDACRIVWHLQSGIIDSMPSHRQNAVTQMIDKIRAALSVET